MVEKLTQDICKLLSDKKAQDITIVDIGHLTVVADKFIICSGRSTTQVKGLAENVEDGLSKNQMLEPLRREGKQEGRWAIIDYGSVVVHIFHEETRQLYSLEQLWSDGLNVKKYTE